MNRIRTMNKSLIAPLLICSAIFLPGSAGIPAGGWSNAQEAPLIDEMAKVETKSPDRYSLSLRMGLNIKADFKNLGSFPAQGHLVPIPGQGDVLQAANPYGDAIGNRTYENGFVWVDSSGNAMGYSRYWGYDSSSQYNPGNGTITMNSSSSPGTSSKDRDGDPQLGFEVTYNRRFGNSESWRWGLEASFNYLTLEIHDNHPLTGTGTLISDVFQLPPQFEGGGFVIPPPAPYSHGPYFTPDTGNPVIGAIPNRLPLTSFAASITGSRSFDADIFGWRVGPYAELPLGTNFSFLFSAGLALAVVASDFHYRETVTFDENIGAGPTTRTSRAGGGESDLLVGGFVNATANFALSEK